MHKVVTTKEVTALTTAIAVRLHLERPRLLLQGLVLSLTALLHVPLEPHLFSEAAQVTAHTLTETTTGLVVSDKRTLENGEPLRP